MSSYQFMNTLGTYPNSSGTATGAGGAGTSNADYYNPQVYNLVSSYNNYFGQNGDLNHQAPHQNTHQAPPPPPSSQLTTGAGAAPHHQALQAPQQLGYCNGAGSKPFSTQNGSVGTSGSNTSGSSTNSNSSAAAAAAAAAAAVAHQLSGQQVSNRTPTPNDCKFSLNSLNSALNHQNQLNQLNGLGSLQHNLHNSQLNGLNGLGHNLGTVLLSKLTRFEFIMLNTFTCKVYIVKDIEEHFFHKMPEFSAFF